MIIRAVLQNKETRHIVALEADTEKMLMKLLNLINIESGQFDLIKLAGKSKIHGNQIMKTLGGIRK